MAESKEYQPNKAEQKLLEALLDPANRIKSVTDLCNEIEITRCAYYRAYKKPEFVALVKDESQRLVSQAIIPLIHTFVKEALDGSFQHGKVLLEMADMYTEKKEVGVSSGSGLTVVIGEQQTQSVQGTKTPSLAEIYQNSGD